MDERENQLVEREHECDRRETALSDREANLNDLVQQRLDADKGIEQPGADEKTGEDEQPPEDEPTKRGPGRPRKEG